MKDRIRAATRDGAGIKEAAERERLPLVVEVVPATAKEGLLKVYEWGNYNFSDSPEAIARRACQEPDSVEDSSIVELLNHELADAQVFGPGGAKPEEIRDVADWAEIRMEEPDQKYVYLRLKRFWPHEGAHS